MGDTVSAHESATVILDQCRGNREYTIDSTLVLPFPRSSSLFDKKCNSYTSIVCDLTQPGPPSPRTRRTDNTIGEGVLNIESSREPYPNNPPSQYRGRG